MSTYIEDALLTYLLANASINALVGDRIYAMHVQQEATMPCITYQRISTERVLTHDQTSTGLAIPRFQFDVYSFRYSEALEIAEALRDALQGYAGAMGTLTTMGVLPMLEQHTEDRDLEVFRLIIDYTIRYEE